MGGALYEWMRLYLNGWGLIYMGGAPYKDSGGVLYKWVGLESSLRPENGVAGMRR